MATTNPWDLQRSVTKGIRGREIDLRSEVHEILFGNPSKGVLPHGRWLVVRHFRTDDDGNKVPCSCRSEVWGAAAKSPQHKCRFCSGHGFFFDDEIKIGYIQWEYPVESMSKEETFGSIELVAPAVYFEYNVDISGEDYVLIPVTTDDGELPAGPIEIDKKLKVNVVEKMRADYGRVEYLRCRISEEHK